MCGLRVSCKGKRKGKKKKKKKDAQLTREK